MRSPRFTNLSRRCAAIIVACSLAGCTSKPNREPASSTPVRSSQVQQGADETNGSAKENTKVTYKKLVLSKRNGSDRFVRLGTLQFDDTNHATLSTEGEGTAVDKLKQDWSDVSKRNELTWKMSV